LDTSCAEKEAVLFRNKMVVVPVNGIVKTVTAFVQGSVKEYTRD
jgi:hypothetical protein